jgi:hypothetical protein
MSWRNLRMSNSRQADAPKHPIDLIQARLDGPLSDPIKVLEAQYELALNELIPLLDKGSTGGEQSERVQRLAYRITRRFLFNYYLGFVAFKFSPSYRNKSTKSNRQRAIEEALQKLARFDFARQLMVEYFMAALEYRLHRKLREYLNAYKSTRNPRYALRRRITRVALADDWEKLGRYNQTFYQGFSFGLSGFSLLFKSTGNVRPEEFEALMNHADRLALECSSLRIFEWKDITDVVSVLTATSLSPEQKQQLSSFVHALLYDEKYAYNAPDVMLDITTDVEKMGFSPTLTNALKSMGKLLESYTGETSQISRESGLFREHESLKIRHEQVADMLALLSGQSQEALSLLQESELLEQAEKRFLPITLNNLPAMQMLATHLGRNRRAHLSDDYLEVLRESSQPLDKEPAEFLLNIIREESYLNPWATQILENVPALTEEADRRIALFLESDESPSILDALIKMYFNFHERGINPPREVEGALLARVMTQLFESEASPRSSWISLLQITGSPLQEVLEQINGILKEGESSKLYARSLEILHAITSWAEQMPQPDAVTLAACWLVDPVNGLRGDRTLLERIQEASDFLRQPADWLTQQTVTSILYIAIVRCPGARLVIAQSLRTLRHPELALPLLEKLLNIAAAGDRYHQDPKLYTEAFKSVVALEPLIPKALALLEKSLWDRQKLDLLSHSTLTPAFVYDQILPLFDNDVSPRAISTLIDLIWHYHCPMCSKALPWTVYEHVTLQLMINEKVHRYLHIPHAEGFYADGLILLCALQSLTQVTNLSLPQQRVILRMYRTSWHTLIKSLSLLILGRQKPIREATLLTLIRVLRRDPTAALYQTMAQYLLRSLLFRVFRWESSLEPHVNYSYLCQGVAVHIISDLLRQQRDNTLVRKHQEALERTLLSAVSFFRYAMEPFLTGYISVGTSAEGTKAMAQIMGVSPEEVEQEMASPSWAAHPSDLAYQALHDLRREKGLLSLQKQRGEMSN